MIERDGRAGSLIPLVLVSVLWSLAELTTADEDGSPVDRVFTSVRQHAFHPLNGEQSFTNDRALGKHGVADLNDADGSVRLMAIRDLVRLLPDAADDVTERLSDVNRHVRQVAAAALGIARQQSAVEGMEAALQDDPSALVRSQAAMSLGQMESTRSLGLLRDRQQKDPSRDVRHQCELAVRQIESGQGATREQLDTFRTLPDEPFAEVAVGQAAVDFTLQDTEGVPWELSAQRGKWVVLIWIFADWCPVCHGEFRELIEMRSEFESAGIEVATIECHDRFRTRVMVGKEIDPEYWFSKRPFSSTYRERIWWPHLADLAGAVGAKYGVDPMAFAVHAEYINRPMTVIIDPKGVVRFVYVGTYWGDRPSIRQTYQMIQQENFEFTHPKRLPAPTP